MISYRFLSQFYDRASLTYFVYIRRGHLLKGHIEFILIQLLGNGEVSAASAAAGGGCVSWLLRKFRLLFLFSVQNYMNFLEVYEGIKIWNCKSRSNDREVIDCIC